MNGNFELPMIPGRRDQNPQFVNIVFAVIVGIFILGIVFPVTREYFFANPLLFVLILMVIYGVKEWILTQALNDVWQSFARKTGLTFASVRSLGIPFIKQPKIEGVYHDHPMLIRKYIVSAAEYSQLYTAIEISLAGNHIPKMEIYTRARLSAARRALLGEGRQFVPVKVDAKQFDRKLFVKSESESFAQAVLSAEGLKDHLLSIESFATDMKIIVKDNKLLYLEKNLIRDNAYLL
nr:hypothetical protein [Fodinibius sp.]NIV13623.1 hypothetical protein [Fodinibius sp.]NIY27369.1 hypothetical protein [Fodinibius sp.]